MGPATISLRQIARWKCIRTANGRGVALPLTICNDLQRCCVAGNLAGAQPLLNVAFPLMICKFATRFATPPLNCFLRSSLAEALPSTPKCTKEIQKGLDNEVYVAKRGDSSSKDLFLNNTQ
ncbi:hypothetical protein L596_016492 [Steinernema carpocapsae]|uniref:Uncharacterized protein n=1 Tax=Steinernema carpocapsae TaxID=34508 RepID=A0A4V6A3F2_STECR|nr:hypothetical protein L596_016492 [Steinernema carpocapsae]